MAMVEDGRDGDPALAAVLSPAPPTCPRRAMVLAAGRGTRLRALGMARPKPLIEVGDRALIDHALDALAEAGVEKTVVNAHHHADLLAHHLEARERPSIRLNREEALLDTGGGVAAALPQLGGEPFFVLNSDLVWTRLARSLASLGATWRDAAMDVLLLLYPTVRHHDYEGRGDFRLDAVGRVQRRHEAAVAPYVYTGAQLLHPRAFEDMPDGSFSMNAVWDRAAERGRLFGIVHQGEWIDAGTPERLGRAREVIDARQGRFL